MNCQSRAASQDDQDYSDKLHKHSSHVHQDTGRPNNPCPISCCKLPVWARHVGHPLMSLVPADLMLLKYCLIFSSEVAVVSLCLSIGLSVGLLNPTL